MTKVRVRLRALQDEVGLSKSADIIYTDKVYTRDRVSNTFKTGVEKGPRSIEQYYMSPDGICDCCGRTLNQYIDHYGLCRQCDNRHFKNEREEKFRKYSRHKYAKKAEVKSTDITNTKQAKSFASMGDYMHYKHTNFVNYILMQPEFEQKTRPQIIDEMYDMDYATYKSYAQRQEYIEPKIHLRMLIDRFASNR